MFCAGIGGRVRRFGVRQAVSEVACVLGAWCWRYACRTAVAVKHLDLVIGDVVETDGRRYEVVLDEIGRGVTLEPTITVAASELHARHSTRPVSAQRALFPDVPSDGEG